MGEFLVKLPKGWSVTGSKDVIAKSDDGSTTVELKTLPALLNQNSAVEMLKSRYPSLEGTRIWRYSCEAGQERIAIYDDRLTKDFSPELWMVVELFPHHSAFITVKGRNRSISDTQRLMEAGWILHWLNLKSRGPFQSDERVNILTKSK